MAYANNTLLGEVKTLLVLLILGCILFFSGWAVAKHFAQKESALSNEEKERIQNSLKIVTNSSLELEELLEAERLEKEKLKILISSLKQQEAEIQYITKIRYISKGTPPQNITVPAETCPTPPPNYTFQMKNGLPVAKFSSTKSQETLRYKYEVADIEYRGLLVLADRKTALTLTAVSTLSPDEEIPLTISSLITARITKEKFFDPNLSLGIGISSKLNEFSPYAYGYISVPLFHPKENELDLLAPKIALSEEGYLFGVDLVSYNLGEGLPLLEDFWISSGFSIDLDLDSIRFDISFGSKL